MVDVRRYLLLLLFRLFDVTILAGACVAASVPGLRQSGAHSLAQFLALRFSVRNFVLFAALLLLWHVIFSFFGLYRSRRRARRHAEDLAIIQATAACTLALLVVGSLFQVSLLGPVFLSVFWLASAAAAILSHHALRWMLGQIRRRGRNLRHILIVGTNQRARKFALETEAQPALGYRIMGFADHSWQGLEEFRGDGFRLVCDLDDLPVFLRDHVIDEIVIALPMKSFYNEARAIGALCAEQGLTARYLSSLFDTRLARATTEDFAGEPLITLAPRVPQTGARLAKRLLDIALSLAAILALSPLLLLAAILTRLASPGPVLFRQPRLGRNKRIFSMYKFRTMVPDAERRQAELEHLNEAGGPVFKIKNDPRITPLGRYLRRSSIDELPQLFNVLKGDMSLVGPRPLPVRDYQGFSQDWQRRRFCVRPGITCLWQVKGRSAIPFERWMQLDLEYIDRCCLRLDLEILARTIPAVLRGSGAV